MAKKRTGKQSKNGAADSARDVLLSHECFSSLPLTEKQRVLVRATKDLEEAVTWLDQNESDTEESSTLTIALDDFAVFLSSSKNGRHLLHILMTERSRKAFANMTPEQRSEAARRAANSIPRKERVAKAVKAAKAASESMTDEQKSERARKAAEARWSAMRKKPR